MQWRSSAIVVIWATGSVDGSADHLMPFLHSACVLHSSQVGGGGGTCPNSDLVPAPHSTKGTEGYFSSGYNVVVVEMLDLGPSA